MKTNALRKTALLLIFATLLTFVSCAENADTTSEQTDADATEAVEEVQTEEETEESFDPGLGSYNFGNATFTILTKGESYDDWTEQSLFAENIEGEAVNDAIFERNTYISETYGVVLTENAVSDTATNIKKAVTADDYCYDVVMPSFSEAGSTAANGYLYNLKELDHTDLSRAWWDQNSVNELTIGGKLFFVSSDISTLNDDATWCTMFNKNMIASYNVASPYELVEKNEWTYENYYNLYQNVSEDLDGDGKLGPYDTFCNLTQDENYCGMYLGSGLRIIDKDENDLPVISLGTDERCVDVLNVVSEIMMDEIFSFNYHTSAANLGYSRWNTQMFEENRGLFWITNLQIVIRLRSSETPMGIVPVPKFDSTDDRYYNVVWHVGSYVAIPASNTELEMASVIIEAMAAKSRELLRPAYFDAALNGKYLRDEESIGMLEIIIDDRVYDLALAYDFGSITNVVADVIKSGNGGSITQKLEKKASSIQKSIDKTVDKFNELSA